MGGFNEDIRYPGRRQDHTLELVKNLFHPALKRHKPARHANAGWIVLS